MEGGRPILVSAGPIPRIFPVKKGVLRSNNAQDPRACATAVFREIVTFLFFLRPIVGIWQGRIAVAVALNKSPCNLWRHRSILLPTASSVSFPPTCPTAIEQNCCLGDIFAKMAPRKFAWRLWLWPWHWHWHWWRRCGPYTAGSGGPPIVK